MIYKLHLTREELVFLSVAVEERQKIINYILAQDQAISPDLLPFEPDPLSEKERERMISSLESSEVIAEKIRLLIAYADRTLEVIHSYRSRSDEIEKAKNNATNQRRIYLKYALNNLKNIPDPEPFPDDLTQDLEIPDPE